MSVVCLCRVCWGAGLKDQSHQALKALRLERETERKWLLLKSLQGSALSKTTLTLSDPVCDLLDLSVAFCTQATHITCQHGKAHHSV